MTAVAYVCATPGCRRVLPRPNATGRCKGCQHRDYQRAYQKRYRQKAAELPAPEEPRVPHDPHQARLEELKHLLERYRPNPIAVAKVAFGSARFKPDGPCLMLDGRPIGFHDLARRTNVLLVEWGLPQLTAEPGWVTR